MEYCTTEMLQLLYEHWVSMWVNKILRDKNMITEVDNHFKEIVKWPLSNDYAGRPLSQPSPNFRMAVKGLFEDEQKKLLNEFESHLFDYIQYESEEDWFDS